MAIDLDYLMPEVREGFYIPSEIKQVWAAELEVLKEVDRICVKHDIPYRAEWGTSLGAVRHGGYIPWDDDLDICMARPDFERFLKIAPTELPEGFSVYNYRNREGYRQFVARVTGADRISFDKEHLKRFAGFPFMCGLDVFVLDYVNKDDEKELERVNEANFVLSFADCLFLKTLSDKEIKEHFKTIKEKYGVTVPAGASDWEVQRTLLSLTDRIMSRFCESEAKGLVQMVPIGLKSPGRYIPLEIYNNAIRRPFENTTVPVPERYNDLLKFKYGNYLAPVLDSGGHNYPYFESQKDELNAAAGENLFDYKFDENDLKDIRRDKDLSFKALVGECLNGIDGLVSAVTAGDAEKLPELQQLVIDLGTLVESVLSGEAKTVKSAEAFCEAIFNYHEALSNGGTGLPDLKLCSGSLRETAADEILSKKFVLFVYERTGDFKYFKDEYERYSTDPDSYVFVAAAPWGYKDYDNSIYDLRTEPAPEGVYAIPFEDFDIELIQPDIIFIQDAFDDRNPVVSVHPSCYSKALKQLTDRLVYIPPYMTDDFGKDHARAYKNLKYYVTVPGVVRCDEMKVWSPAIREIYIEKLVDFAGDKTRSVWEEKITCSASCADKAEAENNGRKRLLIYFDPATPLAYGEKAVTKLKSVLDVLKSNGDRLDTIWYLPSFVTDVLSDKDCDILSEVIGRFESEKIGTVVRDKSLSDVAGSCDAYYGDPSALSELMRHLKKPVMIADVDII